MKYINILGVRVRKEFVSSEISTTGMAYFVYTPVDENDNPLDTESLPSKFISEVRKHDLNTPVDP